jgi:predicted transcriptional regulator with HTH domain
MSFDLKIVLDKVVEEDYNRRTLEVEKNLERFKNLLCEIAKAKKFDLAIWVEGSKVKGSERYEKVLNLLERGNLVKGKLKFTERNAYREYQLTAKGNKLVKKLQQQTSKN